MPLAPGQSLSCYEILSPLGAGAMGEVYRAKDNRLEREVAIKVLPDHLSDDAERLQRFQREAKSIASLNHPNVAQIHSVDQENSTWFLVLELVPGETLEDRIARGALAFDEAIARGHRHHPDHVAEMLALGDRILTGARNHDALRAFAPDERSRVLDLLGVRKQLVFGTQTLVLHRAEIGRLAGQVAQRGLTLVPLELYFRQGRAKIELAVARGKRRQDKRETIRRREQEREMQRAARAQRRR